MSLMLALGEMAFFSAGQNVMHISKFVVKIVFSAGLAFFLRLTENRLGYQFRFQKSLGGSRSEDKGSSWHHPPMMDDIVPPASETMVPLVTETMISLVLETKPLVVQDSYGDSNLTGSSHPEVLSSAQNTSLMACIIGSSICSLLAIIAAACIILSPSRHSKRKVQPKPKAASRSDSLWWNIFKWKWASKFGKQVPTSSSSSGGSRQPRDPSPTPPGAYPVDFYFEFCPPGTVDSFGNGCFVRGGMPPPPPPPPMYVEAMFEDNWNDWLSFVILLPFLLYVLRTLGRLFVRFLNGMKRMTSRRYTTVRSSRVSPVRPDTNSTPLFNVPTARSVVDASKNPTLAQNIIQLIDSQRLVSLQTQLATFIISGTRILRTSLKLMALITFLLHSYVFYMVPALVVLVVWYYLPGILCRLLFGQNTGGMVKKQSQMVNPPIDVDQQLEEANKPSISPRVMEQSIASFVQLRAHKSADVPEAVGPVGRLLKQSIVHYLCVWDTF